MRIYKIELTAPAEPGDVLAMWVRAEDEFQATEATPSLETRITDLGPSSYDEPAVLLEIRKR